MGSQCQPCQSVTQGCKRQQFRQQLKNRQKLKMSRVNSQSKNKLQSIKSIKKVSLQQENKCNNKGEQVYIDQNNEQQQNDKIQNNQHQHQHQNQYQHQHQDKLVNKQDKPSKKLLQQPLTNRSQYKRGNTLQQIQQDFKNIKLPIQSSIKNEYNNYHNNNNNKKILKYVQQHKQIDNSTIHIKQMDSIKQSKLQYEEDEEDMYKNVNMKRKENKVINININDKDNKEKSNNMISNTAGNRKTNTIVNNNNINNNNMNNLNKQNLPHNINNSSFTILRQSKQSPTLIQDYFNPSKVLKDFNRELKQQQQYDNMLRQQQIEQQNKIILKQIQIQVKHGVYFTGYKVNNKICKNGVLKFSNGTEIYASFIDNQIDSSKNVKVYFHNNNNNINNSNINIININNNNINNKNININKNNNNAHSNCIYQGLINPITFKAQGYGKLSYPDGSYYIGQFSQNKPHGKGKQKYSDNSIYEGDFIYGIKQGYGKYITQNQQIIYQGEFKQNKIIGQGKLIYADGRQYKGKFINGQLQGYGEVEYGKQGVKYVGEFKDTQKCGKGKYYYGDGRIWEGEWKDNRQNGIGKYKNSKNQIIQGVWIDGIKNQNHLNYNKK